MKNLIIYYSLDGNTDKLAKYIKQKINADIVRLKPEQEPTQKGVMRYFWGGKSVFFKETPTLINEFPNMEQYDNIFIGSPVWSLDFTPPINTLLSMYSFEGKNIYLFASSQFGLGVDRFKQQFQKRLPMSNIKSFKAIKESLIKSSCKQKQDQHLFRCAF